MSRVHGTSVCTVPSAVAMERLGARLAGRLAGGSVIFLIGDLGTGKTTLVRGLVHQLGYHGVVPSPTFTLMETYDAGGLAIVHLDLYRLDSASQLHELAVRDYLEDRSVLLVEWAERARSGLPEADCEVHITFDQAGGRFVSLESRSAVGDRLCAE